MTKRDRIITLARKGLTPRQIANRLRASSSYVCRVFHDADIPIPEPKFGYTEGRDRRSTR